VDRKKGKRLFMQVAGDYNCQMFKHHDDQ